MNYLSKINRGAILTAMVVLGVVCYLVTTGIIQNNEKPRIKQVCESYLQQEVAYNLLPAAYRLDKPDMPVSVLNDYLAEMKKNIIAFYPTEEQYYKFVIDNRTADLTSQAKGTGIVYQYEKTITKYKDMIFNGDSVNVTFTTSTTIEAKDLYGTGSTIKEKITSDVDDNIILQKIDGVWKVVYATINRPTNNGYPGKMENVVVAKGKY